MKTTPVRWWRDDATRYRSRPPYIAPEQDLPQFEFVPPPTEQLEALQSYLDFAWPVVPRDSLRLREPPPDPWEEFARRRTQ